MAIRVGTSAVKKVYLGTSKVKLIYVDKNLVFADPQTLTVNIGTGISYVSYTATTIDGKVSTGTLYSTTTLSFGYGTVISFSYSLLIGYQISSSASSVAMTSDKSVSFSATARTYSVYLQQRYGGTTYGSEVGSVQYSTNNSTWYTTTGTTLSLKYGTKLYLRNVTSVAGFKLSSVQYNGVTQSASGGVYTITVGAGNYYLLVNYAAQSVSSSISFAQAESITTNTLTKSGFTVNFNISIRVNSCSAGTTIGTVPINYRPASAKSYSTVWRVQSGTSSSTTNANITFNTNGSIVSDTDSTGSGSDGGGGKWGSYSITWYTQIVISGSWSTR